MVGKLHSGNREASGESWFYTVKMPIRIFGHKAPTFGHIGMICISLE